MSVLRPLAPEEALRRPYAVALVFHRGLAVFEEGREFLWEHFEEDGLGPGRSLGLVTPSGAQIYLEFFEYTPEPYGVYLHLAEPLAEAEGALNEVLTSFGLRSDHILWLSPRISLRPHDLWRQDDNGNRFFLQRFVCRADAEHAAREYEQRGHKQFYFVKQRSSTDAR